MNSYREKVRTPKNEFVPKRAAKESNINTAAVILETIQGGAGFIIPKPDYLKSVKRRCEEVGALLVLDEIQPGIGRTGNMFAFQKYDVEPDILVIGKGLGGGLPIGAFCSSREMMKKFEYKPSLGHISTFGGNPVIASAGLSVLETLENEKVLEKIKEGLAFETANLHCYDLNPTTFQKHII